MNNLTVLIICAVIVVVGIILFFILSFRRKYRTKDAIEHYEDIRDDITKVKAGITESKKVSKRKDSFGGGNIIGGIVSLTIATIVFTQVLLPTIQEVNTTGWASSEASLFSVIPLIAIVGIIFVILAIFGNMR